MKESHKQPVQPSVAQDERRTCPRQSVRVEVELKHAGSESPVRLTTIDLSRNGCYIEMAVPLPVGVRVQATLSLGGNLVRVRGCVVTRHPHFGNGIMFLVFEDDGQQILRAFLAQLRAD
jgi:PilZ domain